MSGTVDLLTKPTKTKEQEGVFEQKYKLSVNKEEGGYHSLPKTLRDNSRRISSEWQSQFGNPIGNVIRGLTTEQERYFATSLITKNPKDQGFDEALLDFWSNVTILIPEQGLELDASYTIKSVFLDGEKVEMEIPVHLQQYYQAKFCIAAKAQVAFTKDQKENLTLFKAVLEDLSVKREEEKQLFNVKNDAMLLYTELLQGLKTDKPNEKIEYLIEVLQEPTENFIGANTQTKLQKLQKEMNDNPSKFIKTFQDVSLSEKALLFSLIRAGVITKEGETYYDGEINMGVERVAFDYIKDPTKSIHIQKLKGRLEEVYRNRINRN